MTNSPIWLSQIQFFTSLGFLSLFLILELGLAWVLVYFKLRAIQPARSMQYTQAYRFWVRIFALSLVLGLAAGVPLLIQLGVLWPGFMAKTGEVAGPLLAAAILTTFIVKSCFLGVMLFGQRRISGRVHTLVVVFVALGVTLSVFWVLVLQAWMQAPTGASWVEGHYQLVDWYAVLLNPFVFTFMAIALGMALLSAAFMMLGVTAGQSLQKPIDESHRSVFRSGLLLAMFSTVFLLIMFGVYGLQVADYQPGKAAATMAYWESGERADLPVVGWPSEQKKTTTAAFVLPDAARALLARDETGYFAGLDKFTGMHAPVVVTFWSWRLLWLLVSVLLLISWLAFFAARKRSLDLALISTRWRGVFNRLTYSGFVLVGLWLAYVWFGQLPYAVYGSITTTEIMGTHTAGAIFAGLLAYCAVYALFLVAFIKLVRHSMRYGTVPVGRRRGRA